MYAHSLQTRPQCDWEPLEQHLALVANGDDVFPGAAAFADSFGAGDWGRLLGLWHDLGKYSCEFQARLLTANGFEAHLDSILGKVDHSTAGAQHAATQFAGPVGRILAYCIAGHHGGLPDNIDGAGGSSGLECRLKKTVPDYSAAPPAILNQPRPGMPPLQWDSANKAFQISVFCRMLFSCLVDADFLATESFMQPDRAADRRMEYAPLDALVSRLNSYLESLVAIVDETAVNRTRAGVLSDCREKAELPPGIFSLTVPTGGGKTLSSLAFALRHAVRNGLRRVIYAIPFTSIIEQNADVFCNALGSENVLEHHSNLDPEDETIEGRFAAENWDAPLIVTTNVQLFESLFANKPSRCRKLHRIARSVIVLDECQTLPVTLLQPTLRMLEELCRNYGCSVVLCSATQPAVGRRDDFRIGIESVREIVTDTAGLHRALQRVEVERLGMLDEDAIVERLRRHDQVLCVVNTRAHAAKLFTGLSDGSTGDDVFHLSAQMCAAHRTDVLDRIRKRLDPNNPQPCRVISTQLIEAGVDIDFPVVYRAMSGLDSIAQAAGRCNREGRMERGQVYVFDTDVDPRGDLRSRRQVGEEVAGLHDDLLSPAAIEHFFRLAYWTRSSEWDKEGILDRFHVNANGTHLQFREVAEKYRLIRDDQRPVLVPYGERGRSLIDELRRLREPPGRGFDRRAQRYVVGVHEHQLQRLRENQTVAQYHERFWVLENDAAYSEQIGLILDAVSFDPNQLLI